MKQLPVQLSQGTHLKGQNLNKFQNWELLQNNHEVASLIDVRGFFALKSSENGINIRKNQVILTALFFKSKSAPLNVATDNNPKRQTFFTFFILFSLIFCIKLFYTKSTKSPIASMFFSILHLFSCMI